MGIPDSGEGRTEQATFAAGCFWGVEEVFRQLDGVVSTAVGYTGGHFPNPTYRDVCSDTTGHAEAVQVEYDPSRISYDARVTPWFALSPEFFVNWHAVPNQPGFEDHVSSTYGLRLNFLWYLK